MTTRDEAYAALERAIEGVRAVEGADSLTFLGDWVVVANVQSVEDPRKDHYDTLVKPPGLRYHVLMGLLQTGMELLSERDEDD